MFVDAAGSLWVYNAGTLFSLKQTTPAIVLHSSVFLSLLSIMLFKSIAIAVSVITAASAVVIPRQGVITSIGDVVSGGFGTFYYQGGGYGACGNINPDSALIVAVQYERYQASLCGQTVQITNQNNGKTILAIIADKCPGCANSNSLDLSVGAWNGIGQTEADGSQVPITWTLVN